jgi:large subunit ribosomal protein L4
MAAHNENVERSIHNLEGAHVIRANYLNIRDLLRFDKVVVPLDALDIIKSIWGQES